MGTEKSATLFIQCIVDGIYPEVGFAMVSVLERLGISVDCPVDQTCCGQPAYNAGYRNEARTAARRFIEIFETARVIVSPSGSCVSMIRHHYPKLFAEDARWRRRAEKVAAKTFEFSEYLVDVRGVVRTGARFDGRITYHDSCHLLRYLNIREQPRRLIRNVSGSELIEMTASDQCCGFGGTFAAKYPEISVAMVDEKVKNILNTGADAVVGCDMGCLMNIQGRLSRRGAAVKVLHLAQLLAGDV